MNDKPYPKYKGMSNDIIRIELRESTEEPKNEIVFECPDCKKGIPIDEIVNSQLNKGIKVAYFIQLSNNSFGKVIREAVDIIKLVYRGYYKSKKERRFK